MQDILTQLKNGERSLKSAVGAFYYMAGWDNYSPALRQRKFIAEKGEFLIAQYQREFGASPEEIYLEKERKSEIISMLLELFEVIDKEKILWMHVIERKKLETIGKILGVQKAAVSKRIKSIYKKAKQHFGEDRLRSLKDAILYESEKFNIRWVDDNAILLYEYFQNISVDGHWRTSAKTGKKKFISKTECRLPEYFNDTFGDKKTVCPICREKCTRKNSF